MPRCPGRKRVSDESPSRLLFSNEDQVRFIQNQGAHGAVHAGVGTDVGPSSSAVGSSAGGTTKHDGDYDTPSKPETGSGRVWRSGACLIRKLCGLKCTVSKVCVDPARRLFTLTLVKQLQSCCGGPDRSGDGHNGQLPVAYNCSIFCNPLPKLDFGGIGSRLGLTLGAQTE
jgi:hypothetical protein